jgi:hypothetical protein
VTAITASRTTTSAGLSSFGLEDGPALITQLTQIPPVPETLHVLSTFDEVRAATETVAGSGQRLISVMTPDLEPEIFDQPAMLEVMKRFVLGHSFAKVRVLMRDQARLSNGANRFIAMAHRLTSYLEIRIRAPQYRDLTAAYCIADDRAIVYRPRANRPDGLAGFNNPKVAQQHLKEFDTIWLASATEEREVRIARR